MYDLIVLIAALKQIKKPNMFLWNLLVREEIPETKDKFEVHTKNARRRMAPFVGKYSGGKLFEKDGSTISEFQPGIIKPFRPAHANDLLKQTFGQTVYGEGIDMDEIATDQVTKELGELDEAITRTECWMLGKLLTTGVIPIVGDTVNRAIKFGDFNKEILTGANLWTDPTSDPVQYLLDKQLEILNNTGVMIDSICMSVEAAAAFKNHPKVIDKLKYKDADIIRIQPRNLGDGARFLGTIPEGELDIYTFADWVESFETKESEPIIPAGELIGVRSKSVKVHYGAIAQIVDKDKELFTGSRIPKTWVDIKNDTENIQIASAPLIVPDDAAAFFCAKVVDGAATLSDATPRVMAVDVENEEKSEEKVVEDRFSKMLKEELVDFLVAETGADSKTLSKLKVDELREKAREI